MHVVGVATSAAKKGSLGLSIAMLHSKDLEYCVEFVDDPARSGITAEIVQRDHNEWPCLEPDRPWFKLPVVGQNTVVFVYYHVVGDGTSGYVFHREFHTALNSKTFLDGRGHRHPWDPLLGLETLSSLLPGLRQVCSK